MKIESLNHIAMLVKDAAVSAEFYKRYCGMEIIHDRQDNEIHVSWLRVPSQKDGFMIVLLETLGELSTEPGNMDHLGFYVESRKDVDEIAAMARKEGILLSEPEYAGPIIGYYCMVRDPDGYMAEFSCEQMKA
jgi:catechol 2,3-dioxygenase-like lactoylglutathione lyase family enzyme